MLDNDPELNGKYLGTITKDFVNVSDILKDASYQIRVRKISDYPIFPICKVQQPVGQLLFTQDEKRVYWNYYVSFLNEFVQRGLVDHEMEEDFIKAYKDPEEYCCLFVIDEGFTNFVFIPYPED